MEINEKDWIEQKAAEEGNAFVAAGKLKPRTVVKFAVYALVEGEEIIVAVFDNAREAREYSHAQGGRVQSINVPPGLNFDEIRRLDQ